MSMPMIDETALETFLGQVVSDAGAAVSVLLTHLGDKLGLYEAMADSQPITATELARRTDTNERLVQEWLTNQAAGGYVTYDAATGRFTLPREHALALADESSPALVQGLFDMVASVYQRIDRELQVFRSGTGLSWGDQHHSLFDATERSFRPAYQTHLVQEWIPALDGVHEKLTAGAQVAEVGCGYGAATLCLAGAYPNSTFVGYDYHPPSIDAARKAAAQAGVSDRVRFEVSDAAGVSGSYDLVGFFASWHDTADPVGVARAAKRALGDDGAVLLVEPFAHDRLEDNLTPPGRLFSGASALICVPCSISDGGAGLGALAGEASTRSAFTDAGFATFRRVAQTPQNIVYEARP